MTDKTGGLSLTFDRGAVDRWPELFSLPSGAVMSDSEQRQLHVHYREYQSQLTSDINPASNHVDHVDLLPDVEFIPNLIPEQAIAIDSPGTDRESQPLLSRLEFEYSYNRFSGTFQSYQSCLFNFKFFHCSCNC